MKVYSSPAVRPLLVAQTHWGLMGTLLEHRVGLFQGVYERRSSFSAHQSVSAKQYPDRLPAPISSCHTLTFCSLSLAVFPFRFLSSRPTRPFVPWWVPAECVCVSLCVLAGSSSQLRDKAPLHTANSSLCVPPLPLLQPPSHALRHRNTHIQSFPPKVPLCYSPKIPSFTPPKSPTPDFQAAPPSHPPQSFFCPAGFVH